MAKRRTTLPKGPKHVSEQEDDATSPLIDIDSNPTPLAEPSAKPRPKPRPIPAKKATAPPVPDAVDDSEIPDQRPKRGRSRSDTDGTVPASTVQPLAKKTKISNTTLPVQHGGNVANSRSKPVPPRSPLPSRTRRVVNPGAPDQKRKKRTSAEVTEATQKKENLRLQLEQIEKDKIRMLAQMEAVEEEEQRDEERMVIKDIADLEESHAGGKADTQDGNEGMAGDNDIIMADGENHEDDAFVEPEVDEVDGVPELERPEKVKTVS